MNDFRVHIDELGYFAEGAVGVYLVESIGGGQKVWHGRDGRYVVSEPKIVPDTPREPLFRVPRAALPAILGALSRYLGAVEHPEQLRADYDHLRRRHDLLVDHLMADAVARRPRR